MRSSFRAVFCIFAAAVALSAGPAYAADTQGVMTEVQAYAGQAGSAVVAFVHAVAAGDMASIQKAAFVLSGLIGLIGLWLLVVRPRLIEDEDDLAEADAIDVAAPAESEADRPARLLEAIAAAKAQMSISEAEKKHSR